MLSDKNKYGLGDFLADGLNPCSNGICSLTSQGWSEDIRIQVVLILVLMEYAL